MLEHLTSTNNNIINNKNSINKCNFSCTERAANRVNSIVVKNPEKGDKLRVAVLGGGCAGFRYNFSFEHSIKPNDIVIYTHNISILIDSDSANYLENCTLDYVEELGAAYFKIDNPNASTQCGCGSSFAS